MSFVRAVTLARRPKAGEALSAAVFNIERGEAPNSAASSELPPNSIDVTLRWLSVDPYLRCRFNEDTGVEYTLPYAIGEPLSSAAVGVVERHSFSDDALAAKFQPGTIVQSLDMPWCARRTFTMPAQVDATAPALSGFPDPLPAAVAAQGVDAAAPAVLSVLGVTGLTAYFAVEEAFNCQKVPELFAGAASSTSAEGFTRAVVVSSVAGGTGSVFASLCRRIPGVKVIGLTSTDAKVAKVLEAGVCDEAIAYRSFPANEDTDTEGSLRAGIAKAAGGLPVVAYLDSVGGWISTQVFGSMAPESRVVLCGQISTYDDDVPYPPPLSAASANAIEARKLQRERYLVLRYQERFGEAQAHLGQLVGTGQVPLLTTVHHGLGAAPEAMAGVMEGRNVGKMLVRCGDQ